MVGREQTDDRLKTVVMGAGNILMGDDGIGVHVVRALKEQRWLPDGVDLIDAGTATLDALPLLDGVERLIIIDAVRGGGSPGTIYRFSPDDVSEIPSARVSLHQMSLLDTFKAGCLLGSGLPKITIIGVEPKTIVFGICLSEELEALIPNIISTVSDVLRESCRCTLL